MPDDGSSAASLTAMLGGQSPVEKTTVAEKEVAAAAPARAHDLQAPTRTSPATSRQEEPAGGQSRLGEMLRLAPERLGPGQLLALQAAAGNGAVAQLIGMVNADASAAEPPAQSATGPAAIAERPPPAVPDLSGRDPGEALAGAGGLPPAQMLEALGGVSIAASRAGSVEHARLATRPPVRPRHPGAPSTLETPASTRLPDPAPGGPQAVRRVLEGNDTPIRRGPPPPPEPVSPTALVPEPRLADSGGKLSPVESQQVATALARLPTSDAGLAVSAGLPPQLTLAGSADPGQVHRQGAQVIESVNQAHRIGEQDAGQPMGEDQIYPQAAPETLQAAVPGLRGEAVAAPPADPDETASIIAQQEKAPEIRAAVSQGITGLQVEREGHASRSTAESERAEAAMVMLEDANSGEQAAARRQARQEITGLRGQWTAEQRGLVDQAHGEARQTTAAAVETVIRQQTDAEEEAATHHAAAEAEAAAARREAERQAASERQKAQGQTSGGLLGWVASTAQSLFDKARQAVSAVLERARQAIVVALRAAATTLTAIGDRVLAAFPTIRDRFRRAIQERIAAAEAVVNRLAAALKAAVQASLNTLGAALVASISLYERGLQAAVAGVRSVLQGAMAFARSVVAGLGEFAGIVRDIAANPGQWVANLAAGASDGIRHGLWPDLLQAIEGWFSDKVESVIGLGGAIWSLLRRGGITVAEVAHFTWEAIKSMIPPTVISILIERVVSLLVPAVGAALLIVQAIQAAWASLGRILQAFDSFVTFLKAVKFGNAGPQFAGVIKNGAVAVIEFLSNFLLQRLAGPAASKVGGKLRALAKGIGNRLRRVGKVVLGGGKVLVEGTSAAFSTLALRGRKLAASFDGLVEAASRKRFAKDLARKLLREAKVEAPRVRDRLESVASACGGRMEGLEFEIKTEKSLARKVAASLSEGFAPDTIAKEMKDTMRYTITFSEEAYTPSVQQALERLEASGYRRVAAKNYWGDEPTRRYKGLNAAFTTESGQRFEVQFHTSGVGGSWQAKQFRSHALYEEWRATKDIAREKALYDTMAAVWKDVKTPEGAADLGERIAPER